jgi:hypothetical protein
VSQLTVVQQPQTPEWAQRVIKAVVAYALAEYHVHVWHVSIDGNRVTMFRLNELHEDERFGVATVEDDHEGVRVVDVEVDGQKRTSKRKRARR